MVLFPYVCTRGEPGMNSYVLTCCSTSDYPRSFFEGRDIPYVCFHYEIDGEQYLDDLYASFSPADFYARLKGGAESKTSQISMGEYVEFWEPFLRDGKDVLHVTLSSGISGTYNSACLAARELEARYPDRTVRVLDSLAASSGYGLLVELLADRRDEGVGLDELVAWGEQMRLRVNHWFFVSDLDCLKRGGRVSNASALVASALKICPVMNVDATGRLVPREKIRTKKKATAELARLMVELAEGGIGYDGLCRISHSDCREDAQKLAELVEESIPPLKGKIQICDIGTVIGSHTGPGTVALFFLGAERAD